MTCNRTQLTFAVFAALTLSAAAIAQSRQPTALRDPALAVRVPQDPARPALGLPASSDEIADLLNQIAALRAEVARLQVLLAQTRSGGTAGNRYGRSTHLGNAGRGRGYGQGGVSPLGAVGRMGSAARGSGYAQGGVISPQGAAAVGRMGAGRGSGCELGRRDGHGNTTSGGISRGGR